MAEMVNLSNLGRGAATELFDREFQRVLSNIRDPNTDWKKQRILTLKVVIKPDESRDSGQVEVSVNATLAGIRPFKTNVFMGEAAVGVFEAYESNPQQMGLFEKTQPDPAKVTPIRKEESDAEGSH